MAGVEAGGVDEVLLHVGREGVEAQRSRGSETHEDEEGAWIAQHAAQRAGVDVLARGAGSRFGERSAQVERDDGRHRADKERYAPAPSPQLRVAQELLQD